jgi:hypothetical protein
MQETMLKFLTTAVVPRLSAPLTYEHGTAIGMRQSRLKIENG